MKIFMFVWTIFLHMYNEVTDNISLVFYVGAVVASYENGFGRNPLRLEHFEENPLTGRANLKNIFLEFFHILKMPLPIN